MPKVQLCRNECGQTIVVQLEESSGKWKPYNIDQDGNLQGLHDCPKSDYKKKQQQQWTGTTKQGQMFEARVSQDLQQAETRNNELILKMLGDISRKQDEDRQKMEGIARNVLEILGLLQDQIIKKQQDPETTSPAREEPSTQSERTDYGF